MSKLSSLQNKTECCYFKIFTVLPFIRFMYIPFGRDFSEDIFTPFKLYTPSEQTELSVDTLFIPVIAKRR